MVFEPETKKAECSAESWMGDHGAVFSVLLAASFSTIAILLSHARRQQVGSSQSVPAVYQIFWNRFVTGPQQPWVIFSNGSFVGQA